MNKHILIILTSILTSFYCAGQEFEYCLAQVQDTDKFVKFDKIKMVRFTVNSKGDTIAEKKGYPVKLVYVEDSTMILHLYKGKRYTGKAIFLTKIKNKKGEFSLVHPEGIYKAICEYQNGFRTSWAIYFPNGQLKERQVRIYKTTPHLKLRIELDERYDYKGNLLEKRIEQPGISYSDKVHQPLNPTNQPQLLSGDKVVLLDSTLWYSRTISSTSKSYFYDFDSLNLMFNNYDNEGFIIKYEYNKSDDLRSFFSGYFRPYFKEYIYPTRPSGLPPHRSQTESVPTDMNVRLHLIFYDNGFIKEIGQYCDSLREGKWCYYLEDGTLEKIESYSKGVPCYILYDKNGYVYFSVSIDPNTGKILEYFNANLPDYENKPYMISYREIYDTTGNILDTIKHHFAQLEKPNSGSRKIDENVTKAYLSRYTKLYYDNGQIKECGFYNIAREKTGIWIDFSITGDTVVIQDYSNGVPVGIYAEYINGKNLTYTDTEGLTPLRIIKTGYFRFFTRKIYQ
ncbi:MAG: hypothetical protein ACK4K0_07780 [Flavobacteriales bacterium]